MGRLALPSGHRVAHFSEVPPAMPLNILVVEDEPLIAMDLQTIIEDVGYRLAAMPTVPNQKP